MSPQFFTALLLLTCAAAFSALAGQDRKSDVGSPFDGPLNVPGTPLIIVNGEDAASLFTSAHLIEQDRYNGLYYSHYHGLFYQVNAPVLAVLPSATDKQGRPLWFASGDAALKQLVNGLFTRGQTADLDRLFEDWNNPSERTADGRWKLSKFYQALNDQFSNTEDWHRLGAYISDWRQNDPKSRAAAMTEAIYWTAYAWNARGHGFSPSVTPEGWKIYQQGLTKALSVLEESKHFAAGSPLWTRLYLDILVWLGRPRTEQMKVFQDAIASQRYFYPNYSSVAISLAPKWGGNWKAVDDFVSEAVKDTPDEGASLYARLYWSILQPEYSDLNLYRDTLAKWPQMKQSFEDIVRLYPHSAFNMNNFAAAACMAGDKATFQRLRLAIGKNVMVEAWPTNYSLDLCERNFAMQPPT